MLIECLVKREGDTVMSIGSLKSKYVFRPIPGALPGEMVTSYCDVQQPEHVAYMLSRASFRAYDPDQSQAELKKDRQKARKAVYSGFSIQKHMDKGYIVMDSRDPKHVLYAGQNTPFTDKTANLQPWPTEFEAFEWLKGELAMQDINEEAEEETEGPDSNRLQTLETMLADQAKIIAELKAKLAGPQPEKKRPGRPPNKVEGESKIDSVVKQITGN